LQGPQESHPPEYWQAKSVRDPLYGFIGLTRREEALLESVSMQRLTRIKQLSHSYLVYPSATNNRFQHSLGTLFIADRMCGRLNIQGKRREVIRAAALLHDVGHGPFSHTFEGPLSLWNKRKVSQEEVTRLFLEHDPELIQPLSGTFSSPKTGKTVSLEGIYADVLDVFAGPKAKDVLARGVVSGMIDADKFDYLIRDSYYTGTTYGIFDLERIMSTLTIAREDDGVEYPAIQKKGFEASESFRLARYLLYTQVYQHKTRLIADAMFTRAVELSDNNQVKKDDLILSKGKEFVEAYKLLDDASVVHSILAGPDGPAKSLVLGIRNRKLLKQAAVFEWPQLKQAIIRDFYLEEGRKTSNLESSIASSCGLEKWEVFVQYEDESSALKMYNPFGQVAESGDIPLLVIDERGVPRRYEDFTSLFAAKEAKKMLHVFCPARTRTEVATVAQKKLSKG
jgi:HD superfamily phosphohydrolase